MREMFKFACVGIGVLVSGLATATPVAYMLLPIGPDLEQAGWKVLTLSRKPPTHFVGRVDGVIKVTAESSVAFLYRDVPSASQHKRYLSWRWRVDLAMTPTDLSRKGHDDRPLALHVSFPSRSNKRDLWQRLRRAFIGAPLSGKLLTYVWGGIGQRGDKLVNPHVEGDGVIYILRSGHTPTGQWFTEKIDIAADFERAFGYEAPPPIYIVVSADTDDTASRSIGWIADITFTDT